MPGFEIIDGQDKTVTGPVTREPQSGVASRTGSAAAANASGVSWSDYNRLATTPGTPLSLGSVLKGRFVLESIVVGGDKGGMGLVYKARDLMRQEARDCHPYVAIKVLNEEFKRHPDSIKALQHEARRAQKLSHPNIINVHDFDRDGGNVFMAMELLEGSALDEVIRAHRANAGMPVAEALRIIQALGRALGHAHANCIVHSDFKPSNAFLTTDNTVKVLDFGIARAAKGTMAASTGTLTATVEKTIFDAGTLGALTMPYASCEQIEGAEPDPRDDVYALAVVSYELLTGHHPFECAGSRASVRVMKADAVTARNASLEPAPVKGLTRRQWQALRRGLAFSRGTRSNDAMQFVDALMSRKLPRVTAATRWQLG